MVEKLNHNIYHILMRKILLYFDKKYKCVTLEVHYNETTLTHGVSFCTSRTQINFADKIMIQGYRC